MLGACLFQHADNIFLSFNLFFFDYFFDYFFYTCTWVGMICILFTSHSDIIMRITSVHKWVWDKLPKARRTIWTVCLELWRLAISHKFVVVLLWVWKQHKIMWRKWKKTWNYMCPRLYQDYQTFITLNMVWTQSTIHSSSHLFHLLLALDCITYCCADPALRNSCAATTILSTKVFTPPKVTVQCFHLFKWAQAVSVSD